MATEPATSSNTPERAKQYKRARIAFFVVGIIFSWVTSALFVFTGLSRRFADKSENRIRRQAISEGTTVTLFILFSWIISFPLSYLRGHRLEHQYEMSNQSFPAWLGEQLKGLALQLVLMVPITQGMLAVIRRRPRDWWAMLSLLAIPFTVILAHLAPVLIMPLFNKYEPLRDQELAERLKRLAERSGIRVAEILQMDMSRQTKAANAFVTGIGSTKRIVLSDTLMDELSYEEIETIVAHEIAHQANHDIWRLLTVGTVTTAGTAWLTQRLFEAIHPRTRQSTSIRDAGYVEALPLLGLLTSLVGMLAMPLQNAYSRHIERRADRFALELTNNPDAFASGLEKIADVSLADPDPPRIEQVLLHSHPTIKDRLESCREFVANRQSA
jgi:STE24 endopeptidase